MKLMFNKIITTLTLATLIALPVSVLSYGKNVSAQAVSQDTKNAACQGIGTNSANCGTQDDGSGVNSLIADVINILSFIVGIAAVIMIIVGGFRYVTSGGDSNNVSAAKSTILFAVIGLVIAALAQAIVRFVFMRVTT